MLIFFTIASYVSMQIGISRMQFLEHNNRYVTGHLNPMTQESVTYLQVNSGKRQGEKVLLIRTTGAASPQATPEVIEINQLVTRIPTSIQCGMCHEPSHILLTVFHLENLHTWFTQALPILWSSINNERNSRCYETLQRSLPSANRMCDMPQGKWKSMH
jgi:hypothetical protein